MLLVSILLASMLGGVLSVVVAGFLMKGLPQYWLPRMIGFSAGLLLGAAMLSILPEAFESGADSHTLFAMLLVGFLGFYALQRIMLWRHSHSSPGEADSHAHGLGRETALTIVVGDGFHNFVDGIMIAAAFLTDPALGWATAIAVIAHEIPQEAGDFVLLLSSGLTWRRALALNALSSLASVVGALTGYIGLSYAQALLPYALVLAAASFVYIASQICCPSCAVKPWVRRSPGRRWRWRPGLRWLLCWRLHTVGDGQRSKLAAALSYLFCLARNLSIRAISFFCAEMMPLAIFLICGSLPTPEARLLWLGAGATRSYGKSLRLCHRLLGFLVRDPRCLGLPKPRFLSRQINNHASASTHSELRPPHTKIVPNISSEALGNSNIS